MALLGALAGSSCQICARQMKRVSGHIASDPVSETNEKCIVYGPMAK